MTTVSQALQQSSEILSQHSETPNLDAQTLLAHVLGKSRAWIIAHPQDILPSPSDLSLNEELYALKEGTPLPYVLGHWEFYCMQFKVSPDVLIPRPETELLVEQGIDWLKKNPNRRLVTDIGTGSGCIAVAIAKHLSDLFVVAADNFRPALKIATSNAQDLSVIDQIYFVQADLYPPVRIKFDLICANLPYIPTASLHQLEIFEREPTQALDGGVKGLDLIHKLIIDAPNKINPGGRILIEIDSSQGEQVTGLAQIVFTDCEVEVLKDLAGHDRLVIIQLPDNK